MTREEIDKLELTLLERMKILLNDKARKKEQERVEALFGKAPAVIGPIVPGKFWRSNKEGK